MPYGTEDVTMTTPQEQLSALVDGELPDYDSDRLLVALASDPALRDQWSRYQLIGTAIRRGVPDMHDPGLAQRIAAAVSQVEPEGDVEPLRAARDERAPGRLRRAARALDEEWGCAPPHLPNRSLWAWAPGALLHGHRSSN